MELLRLLRASPGSSSALLGALDGADFPRLTADATRHGLSAVVAHALARAELPLTSDWGEALRLRARSTSAIALRVKQQLLRALDALGTEGIVPVLLKGYGLGLRLYDDPLLRAATDVDLWVLPQHLGRAERALTAIGLKRSSAEPPDGPVHHQIWTGRLGVVELHFRPLSTFGHDVEGESFWARAWQGQVEGRPVRYLAPEDELVYLSLHATHHLLQRLSWLYDLKLMLLAHPQLCWDRVKAAAAGPVLAPLVYFALEAAQRAVAAPVPPEALRALAPAAWRRRVARVALSEERLRRASLERHRSGWLLTKLLLAPDLRKVGRLGAHRMSRTLAGRMH